MLAYPARVPPVSAATAAADVERRIRAIYAAPARGSRPVAYTPVGVSSSGEAPASSSVGAPSFWKRDTRR